MGTWSTITTDLKMDSNYGDFEIIGGDIFLNKNKKEILKDVIIERFKTSSNDFILNPEYGADLERYLGKGIDQRLKESLLTSFKYSLTYDGFIDNNELDIVIIQVKNQFNIFVYITINNEQERVIEAIYNKEGISF